MTLLWIEGFDSFGITTDLEGHDFKYPNSTNLFSNDKVVAGRFGGYAFEWENTSGVMKTPPIGSASTMVLGIAFRVDAFVGLSYSVFTFYETGGATTGVNLYQLDDGAFSVRRGSTVLGTTANNVISTGTWHYLELKVVVHDTTGSYEFRVDGVDVLSASSVDTKAGDGLITHASIHGATGTHGRAYDDWYILDGDGSVNNDFLGSRKVLTIFPDGAGDTTEWTPDSSSNYGRVAENPIDGDTSYVESSVTNAVDLYTFGDLASASSVDGIQINAVARVTDVDPFDLKLLTKTGATTDSGSAIAVPSSSYSNKYRLLEQDPDTTAAWTPAGVDGAQFGLEVAS